MPRKDTGTAGQISAQAQQDLVSEGIENFELPKSLVTKIAKSAIPENAKLQKETVLSLVKGSTVFINYLAATAHDVAVSKQHKSISASDVLKALETIEFGDLVDKLQAELLIYREQAKTDKSKKGSSNVNSASAGPIKIRAVPPGTASAPVPATKASKGKEKEKLGAGPALPPPFTSTPLETAESISTGARMAMDVDWEEELGEAAGADTEGEVEGDIERDIERDIEEDIEEDIERDIERDIEGDPGAPLDDDEDIPEDYDDDEDDGAEGEVPDDAMEIEEELKRDTRGLEDPPYSDA